MYQTLNLLKQNSPWIIKKKEKEKEKRHKCKHCHIKKVFYSGGVWNLLFSTFLVFWWNVGNDVYATAIKKIVHGISPENKNHSQTRCGWRKKVLQTENLWACITGQIVFVLESFGSKATRSECLLILHMALQLDLYQNFVHTFNPASSYARNVPPPPTPTPSHKIQMLHPL